MIAEVKFISHRPIKMQLLAVLLIALFISFVLASVIVKAENLNNRTQDKMYYTNITVEKGDTLWAIAEEHMDSDHYSSIYKYMDELKQMNNLTSDNLYSGQNLIITYYSDSPEN